MDDCLRQWMNSCGIRDDKRDALKAGMIRVVNGMKTLRFQDGWMIAWRQGWVPR